MASAPEGLGIGWPDIPFFPGSHNLLSINLSTLSRTLSTSSVSARDQFSVLKYTHSSPNVYRVEYLT